MRTSSGGVVCSALISFADATQARLFPFARRFSERHLVFQSLAGKGTMGDW